MHGNLKAVDGHILGGQKVKKWNYVKITLEVVLVELEAFFCSFAVG